MGTVSEKIALYHQLCLGCTVLSFVCLQLSVILFFRMKIADTIRYLHGVPGGKQLQKIVFAREKEESLYMEREILFIHTDEIIE